MGTSLLLHATQVLKYIYIKILKYIYIWVLSFSRYLQQTGSILIYGMIDCKVLFCSCFNWAHQCKQQPLNDSTAQHIKNVLVQAISNSPFYSLGEVFQTLPTYFHSSFHELYAWKYLIVLTVTAWTNSSFIDLISQSPKFPYKVTDDASQWESYDANSLWTFPKVARDINWNNFPFAGLRPC